MRSSAAALIAALVLPQTAYCDDDQKTVVTAEAVRSVFIIQSSASPSAANCQQDYLASEFQRLNGSFQRHDFYSVAPMSEIIAGNAAKCALQAGVQNFPVWSAYVGQVLLTGVSASARAYPWTEQVAATSARAKLLLEYASAAGVPNAPQYLEALESLIE